MCRCNCLESVAHIICIPLFFNEVAWVAVLTVSHFAMLYFQSDLCIGGRTIRVEYIVLYRKSKYHKCHLPRAGHVRGLSK